MPETGPPPVQPASFDFDAHRMGAVEKYGKLRPLYGDLATAVGRILEEVLSTVPLKVHSVQARAKSIDSFARKASLPSEVDDNSPKYSAPLEQITDLAGVRVITFLPRDVATVGKCIASEFEVAEKIDVGATLLKEDRFGYQSVHYIVKLKESRTKHVEYARFGGLACEVQVRTVLQHAWAEIEHDIEYKSSLSIPAEIRRRFTTLAGVLEVADREFQAISDANSELKLSAAASVQKEQFSEAEVTPDALRLYLIKRVSLSERDASPGTAARLQNAAVLLKVLGFSDLGQVEECIRGFNSKALSRLIFGSIKGPFTRFELLLLAGMGENFVKRHPLRTDPAYSKMLWSRLSRLGASGVATRKYVPEDSKTTSVTSAKS